MSKKDKAFELFDEGKTPIRPEVKALRLRGTTKYNYYRLCRENRGITASPQSISEAKTTRKGKGKTVLLGGESVASISEVLTCAV